jgi:hypothetical protein
MTYLDKLVSGSVDIEPLLQLEIAPPRCAAAWLRPYLELDRQPVNELGIDALGLWLESSSGYGR